MTQRAKSGLALVLTSVFSMASLAAMSQTVADTPALAGAPSFKTRVISVAERDFLKKAAQCNNAAVQLGQMAQTRGSSDAVRELGQRIVNDHEQIKKKLEGLAKERRVDWPSDMHYKHEDASKRLSELSGAEFDRAFLQALEKMHEKDIKMYREIAEYGSDKEIMLFARQRLPIMRDHLRDIRRMN